MTDNPIIAYAQAIEDGSVVVGQWVRRWYEKLVRGLDDGSYLYSAKRARHVIRFVESFCRHHEGPLAPQLLTLELWQKAFLATLYGVVDADGARHFREAVLVVGRKNGKTLLLAAIAAYTLYCSAADDYGARVFFAAPKLEQANLGYEALYQMISKDPDLSEITRKRRTDIYVAENNSSAKPIAFSAKKSDGLNISLGICDEFGSWSGEQGLKFYEVLKSSQGSRKSPLLLSISTAGYVSDSVYDELLKRSTSVLLGSSKETRLAPVLYMIDDIDRWTDIQELRKSNPNLGISITEDYLAEEMRVAEGSLPKRAEFLTKYCNIKQNASTAWLDYDTVAGATGEALSLEDFRGCYCVVGLDLSQTTDLTSVCALIERDGELYAISKFYMPAARLETAIAEDGVPYDIYRARGFLQLSGENYVDYADAYRWIVDLIERYEIYPLQIGYDRYSAQYLIKDLKAYGYHVDDVYQGYNLTPVIRELEGIIRDGHLHIGNNSLLQMHLLNTALKSDTESAKVKAIKLGTRTRIDGAAALLDAMTVRQKWADEIGEQLKNQT